MTVAIITNSTAAEPTEIPSIHSEQLEILKYDNKKPIVNLRTISGRLRAYYILN